MDYIDELFRKLKMLFLDAYAVSNDINSDIWVYIAQHVQVNLHGRVYLNYILLPHSSAANILDYRDRAVKLIEMQVFINLHALSCLYMVQNNAVMNAVDIHFISPCILLYFNAQKL